MKKTTFSELREKEVINCCSGIKLGYVIDLEIDEECGRICAIIVSDFCKRLFSFGPKECIIIGWENIQKIGEDIIVVGQEVCCPVAPPKRRKFWW